MAGPKVLVGGRIVDPQDAQVSVFDRGFLYGDSVYETLRIYDGVPFAFDAHIERLFRSARSIGFDLPWAHRWIQQEVRRTLDASGLQQATLRLTVSRGRGALGADPGCTEGPHLVVMVQELPASLDEIYTKGRNACIVDVQRFSPEAIDPQAKTGNSMSSILATAQAHRQGANEAIMLNGRGEIAEAATANVFAHIKSTWVTPPLGAGILGGITRHTIIALCAHHGIPCEERVLVAEDLSCADEIFLSSSIREIVPIVTLNDTPIGLGQVGPHTQRMHKLYGRWVRT